MVSAFIVGVTGQDGTYLAELLIARGYRIVGLTRDVTRAVAHLPSSVARHIVLEEWDLVDPARITDLFRVYVPAEAYNFASRSSGESMFEDPVHVGLTSGIAVTSVLEAIRNSGSTARLCQASSSEMFGNTSTSPQSEQTEFRPRSPYGAAKLYAHSMIDVYRRIYGLYACSAILFNHESPRRRPEFVTRKVSLAAARLKLGLPGALQLGNLDSRRDWGYAGDYVQAMWSMLQQPEPGDYVIASGVTHTVRELCEVAFAHVGLDYRDHLSGGVNSSRPEETVELVGDARKARAMLGWQPQTGFRELVRMMVDADLDLLRGQVDSLRPSPGKR